ncbi:MAG: transcription-repair coupling factor [Dehalococcoidia bacterium]|nr:transcription-repair coupling factor [Dehalococcoidia bacterium]
MLAGAVAPFVPGGGGPVRLGVPETAKAALATALAAHNASPTLLLAPAPARAHALFEEVALFLDGVPLARLPEREALPYELARTDHAARVERARALALLAGQSPALVVASWAALAEHCAGPGAQAGGIELQTGQAHDPLDLVAGLERLGYEITYLADQPGTAARRGGILDVWPAGGEHPLRIEFFGSEVESIRRVELATQRSIGHIDAARIPPAATGTRAAREAARALLGSIGLQGPEEVREQLELVAGGERSDFEGFLEPLLYQSTALDHLSPAAMLIIDDFEDGREALARHFEHDQRARAEQEARETIPPGLPALAADPDSFATALHSWGRTVHLQRFGAEELGARRLPLASAPSFAGRLKTLAEQSRAWANQGLAVVVASQQALRIAELMDEDGIPCTLARSLAGPPIAGEIAVVPLAVAGGLALNEQLVLISDTEIFGFRKRRRPTRARTGIRSDLVSTLEVGDYLVHADHGIARFGGLVRRTIDGFEREYLELQYAQGDRLYAPVDQLESVSRYVGPTDHPPALTRLGSGEWARARRKVRQAIVEMAQDLLELYAKREVAPGFAFPPDNAWQMEMEAAFPFVETPDQLEAITEVKGDMERSRPMDRLICGDVGYGKTEVAVRAAFKAVTAGKQAAVLVPTTVLAEQHGSTFRERTAGFPVRVEVLSRFRSEQEQRAIVAAAARGEVDILIGTHRLLQKDVRFKDLGLVIIDEEQRFGVAHKERLKQMRAEVDFLSLSATPIPRTLQMSLAGIRDMSTVMTPPEERLPIRTYVMEWDNEIIREAIDRELQRGGQVYFVHNRVHDIERVVTRIRNIIPEANIAVGHGQMPEEQLERVMMEFGAGDHDVLVCTTIIESGLDIPNVNTIIIDQANHLGLAQLYQLRGRVGRGANRAYAYLLYSRDRSMSETAQKRLEAIFEATELGAGFQIALRDLEIRGAGNVLGTEQSGHIAAVGFEMYSRLVADAVAALKKALRPAAEQQPAPLPPAPAVDLPLGAHIPASYIEDLHARLAVYERIAGIENAEAVAEMQAELHDRFGPVPLAVDNLLYVQLLKAVARRAGVESIKTDEQMLHLRVRGGLSEEQRRRVQALALPGVLAGPNQVRVDRGAHASDWMALLIRIARALATSPPASRQRPEVVV